MTGYRVSLLCIEIQAKFHVFLLYKSLARSRKGLDETHNRKTGSYEIGKRTGRKRKTSKAADRRIGIECKKNPRATLR